MYLVDIDFDDASKAWNQNKARTGEMYTYKCVNQCQGSTLQGKPCKRKTPFTHCKQHEPKQNYTPSMLQQCSEKYLVNLPSQYPYLL